MAGRPGQGPKVPRSHPVGQIVKPHRLNFAGSGAHESRKSPHTLELSWRSWSGLCYRRTCRHLFSCRPSGLFPTHRRICSAEWRCGMVLLLPPTATWFAMLRFLVLRVDQTNLRVACLLELIAHVCCFQHCISKRFLLCFDAAHSQPNPQRPSFYHLQRSTNCDSGRRQRSQEQSNPA